jgi:hypothetical protein
MNMQAAPQATITLDMMERSTLMMEMGIQTIFLVLISVLQETLVRNERWSFSTDRGEKLWVE